MKRDSTRLQRLVLAFVIFLLALGADLWSKQWAWDTLRRGYALKVIPDVLHFKFGFNTGSAFSLLSNASWAREFFITITLLALLYMAWLATQLSTRYRYGFVAIGLIAGGAAGNLHDRLVRNIPLAGSDVDRYGVVDFIQFFYDFSGKSYWPIFNIADSALMCGVGLLLLFMYRHGEGEAPAERE